MRGVEVRIRHENDDPSESAVLAEVPFTEEGLDETIRLIKAWSVSMDGDSFGDAYASFQIQDGRVWFDVSVTS
jgi:hypothetical protein